MKYLVLLLILTASAFGQQLKTPGVNGENIVNPAFRNAVLPTNATPDRYLKSDGAGGVTWATVTAAPSGTGFAKVTSGVWGTPSATIPHTDITGLGTAATAAAPAIDITAPPFNAVGDALRHDGGSISSGSTTLTSSSGGFETNSVGKFIRVVGAGVAGADLVTTIAARTNSTTVTLATAASTTVAAKTLYWGTDNSAAIQAAIDAAVTSMTTKTVFFPPGRFLCNVTSYGGIKLMGAGGGGSKTGADVNYINLNDYSLVQTALIPALATQPVVKYVTAFDARIEGIMFVGGPEKLGYAVQVGAPDASLFVSANFSMARCGFYGFLYGISLKNSGEVILQNLHFGRNTYGIWFGSLDGTGGGASAILDSSDSNNCDYIAWSFAGGGGTLRARSCDFNYPISVSNVSSYFDSVNVEDCSGDQFLMRGDRSIVRLTGHVELRPGGATIANYSTSTLVDVSASIFSNLTYKTAGKEYPDHMHAGTIKRYSDTTWATLRETENAATTYGARLGSYLKYDEYWTNNVTTGDLAAGSIFGNLGWKITNITNTFKTKTQQPGALDMSSGSSSVGTAGRMALTLPIMYGNSAASYWIFETSFYTNQAAFMKMRVGLYELETTATMNPPNGIGLLIDPVVSTYAQLEVRVAGVSTLVPTTVLNSSFTSGKNIKLERRQSGVFLVIYSGSTGLPVATQVTTAATLPSALLTLGFFSEITTGGSWQDHQISSTRFRFTP